MLNSLKVSMRKANEEGATAVEYGIMVALIAAVIIAIVVLIGRQTCEGFETVNDELANAATTINTTTKDCA